MVNEEKAILKYLIEHKETKYSINQLAKARDINYKSAYLNIQKLAKRKIIQTEHLGNQVSCSFNYNFDPLVFEVESERRTEILQEKKINSIYREISPINSPFLILILFGSYAKRTSTKTSDIDLLLISDDNNLKKQVNQILSLLPFAIHLNELTIAEFLSMLKSREFSVVEEVKKNNILLFGIENYYNLINK